MSNSKQANIQLERQFGSGSFTLDFLGGFTSVYSQVQNVLVLLHGEHNLEDGILMLSAHYDSPAGAHAASDNAANVANALEILRILSLTKPERPVLFMFTGAEETILQGSHMFAKSNHPWVKHVKAFINIESAGSGGREMFFQTTSSKLAKAWAESAPYPHGSIVGQEVFQSGIIPSDTDFRMYRDVLNIPGIDIANVENGHVYHTILDTAENIPPGAMQRYGENVLATMKTILKNDEFWLEQSKKSVLNVLGQPDSNDYDSEFLIFFDVLGFFVVMLSTVGALVFTLLGAAIVLVFYKIVLSPGYQTLTESTARRLAWLRLVQMLIRSIVYPLMTGLFLAMFSPMVFYSRQWLTIFIYFTPALYGVATSMAPSVDMIPHKDEDAKKPTPARREILSFALGSCLWGLFALVLLLRGKGSAYLAWLWCVVPPATRMIFAWRGNYITSQRRRELLETREAAVAGMVGCVIPLILTFQLLFVVIKFFVPISGRSGSRVPGDAIVAVVCGFCVFLVSVVPASIIQLLDVQSMKTLRKFLLYTWLSGILFALALRLFRGHGASSFSADYPKRIYAVHVDLQPNSPLSAGIGQDVLGHKGSYIWVIDADSTTSQSVLDHMHRIDPSLGVEHAKWINCDDRRDSTVYCGLPWYLPLKNEIPNTVLIPTVNPLSDSIANKECSLVLKKKEQNGKAGDHSYRYHFDFVGNERANLFFKDEANGGILNWSLEGAPMATGGHLYVLYAAGKLDKAKLSFWVDANHEKLDVAWACHFTEETTEELTRFVNALPEWSTPVSFVSRWKDERFA